MGIATLNPSYASSTHPTLAFRRLLQLRRSALHIRILPAMPQRMIHQYQRQHRFGDRGSADADAGVVAAFGGNLYRVARLVDGVALDADAGGGFYCVVRDDVLPGGDAAEDAACVVG